MREPPIEGGEAKRVAALWMLDILDSPPEARFDRITLLATKALGVPIATITLIDSSREWFKSAQGTCERECPRAFSFCGHAVLQEGPFIVEDTLEDERFRDNPWVVGAPGVRFYAGQALAGPAGQRVGVFCVKDTRPRALSAGETEIFLALAAWAEFELNFGSKTTALLRADIERRLELLAERHGEPD